MAKKAAFTVKKVISVLAILAVFLGFIAAGIYLYVLPTVDLDALTNPGKIVESPERERVYQITDEFISTYSSVTNYSELVSVGSKEWLENAMKTLENDQESITKYDPLHMQGTFIDKYNGLVDWEIKLLRLYVDLYNREPEDGWEAELGHYAYDAPAGTKPEDMDYMSYEDQWNKLYTQYDAFKAADSELKASLAEKASKSAESKS